MSLSAATLRKMLDLGLTLEQACELAEVWEAGSALPDPTANALRQRRYRERKRNGNATQDVTRDVTRDVTPTPSPKNLSDPSFNSEINQTLSPPKTPLKGVKKVPGLAKPNGFGRFWEAYPNKVGKRAAELEYERALKRISGPDPPGAILAGLERAKQSRKWREEPEFIPHPRTWLHQGRWEDQPLEATPHERPHNDPRQTARAEGLRAHHAGAMAALNRRIGPVG